MSSNYYDNFEDNSGALAVRVGKALEASKALRKKASGQASGIPADFEMTSEFSAAFELMEHTRKHLYITGKAGTGKSTLLQYFKEKTKKSAVVLAPTGIAAINIGGATIHSFFRFPSRLITENDVRKRKGQGKLFTKLDTLVIDEVSMVRADILDGVDLALRKNRDRPDEPFGGVQVVLFGDLYQLAPVVEQDLQEYFEENYTSPFFFSANVMHEIQLGKIELQRIFRQHDPGFIELLNKVRNNEVQPDDLTELNKRHSYMPHSGDHELAITLTSTNALASEINLSKLAALQTKEYTYEAMIDGTFEEKSYPTDPKMKLRAGAQVMMLRNDQKKRWFNGTLGVIKSLTAEAIEVEFESGSHWVEPCTWEKIEYAYGGGAIEPKVVGTFIHFPIKLAWAITIHKSQGKTFDRVIIDLGNGAFTHAQTYVALSRCKTFEGIQLKTKIRRSDIRLDPRVREFLE